MSTEVRVVILLASSFLACKQQTNESTALDETKTRAIHTATSTPEGRHLLKFLTFDNERAYRTGDPSCARHRALLTEASVRWINEPEVATAYLRNIDSISLESLCQATDTSTNYWLFGAAMASKDPRVGEYVKKLLVHRILGQDKNFNNWLNPRVSLAGQDTRVIFGRLAASYLETVNTALNPRLGNHGKLIGKLWGSVFADLKLGGHDLWPGMPKQVSTAVRAFEIMEFGEWPGLPPKSPAQNETYRHPHAAPFVGFVQAHPSIRESHPSIRAEYKKLAYREDNPRYGCGKLRFLDRTICHLNYAMALMEEYIAKEDQGLASNSAGTSDPAAVR